MYVYANCDATIGHDGGRVRLHVDQVWYADDPFVKAHRDLFSPTPVKPGFTVPVVEQASAAPGEKRATRRVA